MDIYISLVYFLHVEDSRSVWQCTRIRVHRTVQYINSGLIKMHSVRTCARSIYEYSSLVYSYYTSLVYI